MSSKKAVFEAKLLGFPPTRGGLRRCAHAISLRGGDGEISALVSAEKQNKTTGWLKIKKPATTKNLVFRLNGVKVLIFVYQKMYTMAIVETTSRQFRERQKDFFELADKGEKVVIRRGRKQTYVLTPVTEDDLYFTPEMIQRIKEAQQEIKEGKLTVLKNKEELDAFFDSL